MTNKRDAILDAAIARMATEGMKFRTEDVASDAGCSQSLVFRYYDTKEGVVIACFNRICSEIRSELEKVSFPSECTAALIQKYLVDVWDIYCDYLRSNRDSARVYIVCVAEGYKYPQGYESPNDILKRILSEHYDTLMLQCPNIPLVAEYMIIMANTVAVGLSSGWDDVPDVKEEIKKMMMNGLISLQKD